MKNRLNRRISQRRFDFNLLLDIASAKTFVLGRAGMFRADTGFDLYAAQRTI